VIDVDHVCDSGPLVDPVDDPVGPASGRVVAVNSRASGLPTTHGRSSNAPVMNSPTAVAATSARPTGGPSVKARRAADTSDYSRTQILPHRDHGGVGGRSRW
jgi:hypothetical protein